MFYLKGTTKCSLFFKSGLLILLFPSSLPFISLYLLFFPCSLCCKGYQVHSFCEAELQVPRQSEINHSGHVHFHSSTQKSKQQQDWAPPQFTLRKGICDRAKEATEILVTPFQHCTLIYSVSESVKGSKYISTKDYFKSLTIYYSLILL